MRRLLEFGIGISLAWVAGLAFANSLPAPATAKAPAPNGALPAPAAKPPLGGLAAPGPPVATGAAPDQPGSAPVPPEIGPAYDDDTKLPAHAETVASYTLRASLDPVAHTLHGEGQIAWRNTSREPQKEVFVHLYLNAFKNQRTHFMRFPAAGFRGSSALSDWGHITVKRFAVREMEGKDLWPGADKTSPGDPEDETDIRVPLPKSVEPGGALTIDVAWDEHLPTVTLRTGYYGSFHFLGQWFPKLARLEPDGKWAHFPFHHLSEFYADYGAYDVTIDTPAAFVVGATGRLEAETPKGDRIERRYTQEDVHDFAFTAWDHFREVTGKSKDGVALRCLFPPGLEDLAAIEMDTVRYGLDYLGKAFGRYPYGTLTIVHPPAAADEAGGMEYPTLITTGGAWFLPRLGVRGLELVTIHELGHQWFYGLVGTNEHVWPFLDEGVNSYAEADSMEARFPEASAVKAFGLSVSIYAGHRAAAADRARAAPVAQGAGDFVTGGDYGSLVYGRTATILRTLAGVYGADKVRRAVGRYARRYRFQHPGPEEFIASFREVLGPEAAEQLRIALFDRGSVDYVVDSIESERSAVPGGIFGDPASPSAAPPANAAAWHGSAVIRRLGSLRFPVDVVFLGEDGAVEQKIRWEARESSARLDYAGKSRLSAVVIDPDHLVLLDDNLSNNARRASPALVGPRVLERSLFGAEVLLSTVLP